MLFWSNKELKFLDFINKIIHLLVHIIKWFQKTKFGMCSIVWVPKPFVVDVIIAGAFQACIWFVNGGEIPTNPVRC